MLIKLCYGLTVKLNVDENILQFKQKTSLTFRKWVERFKKILKGWGKFVVHLVLVVWRLDNAIHWINLYPVDSAERFTITYSLDNNLSNRWCHPSFIQLGPVLQGEANVNVNCKSVLQGTNSQRW